MGVYRVDNTGHQDTEHDVAIEVASLSDGSRYNCGAGGSKRALNSCFLIMLAVLFYLEKKKSKIFKFQSNEAKVCVSYKLRP